MLSLLSAAQCGRYDQISSAVNDMTAPEILEKLKNCITAYRLPVKCDAPVHELLKLCSNDKKRESGNINYIVCREIGKAEIKRVTVDEFNRLMEGK